MLPYYVYFGRNGFIKSSPGRVLRHVVGSKLWQDQCRPIRAPPHLPLPHHLQHSRTSEVKESNTQLSLQGKSKKKKSSQSI
jgi:hypothetical protein